MSKFKEIADHKHHEKDISISKEIIILFCLKNSEQRPFYVNV